MVDRAVANVAAQNQVAPGQLRDRLLRDGIDYGRFRDNLRDQIAVERMRERDVSARIQITDFEIDALLDKQRAAAGVSNEYNIAQVLVTVRFLHLQQVYSKASSPGCRRLVATAGANCPTGSPAGRVLVLPVPVGESGSAIGIHNWTNTVYAL